MPRKRVLIPLIFLAALIALVACNGQAAPPDQRFSSQPTVTGTAADVPTGTPTAEATITAATAAATPALSVATRVIEPTVGGTIAVPTRHVEPAATGTLVAQNPQIEIITASPQHLTIKPGETTGVTPINNSITVMIHYPVPLGSTASGSFQPYPYTINVDPPDWQPQVRNPPNAQTLHFELAGSAPGPHVVTVTVPQLGPPVRFTLNIATASLTPVAAGTAVPTAGPASTPTGGLALTIDDNGKTITLHKGDQFLLRLPEGYNWNVSIANPSVVSYATGFVATADTQGLYVAKQAGQTTFSATGDPICRSAKPPCALPSRLFKVTIVVQ